MVRKTPGLKEAKEKQDQNRSCYIMCLKPKNHPPVITISIGAINHSQPWVVYDCNHITQIQLMTPELNQTDGLKRIENSPQSRNCCCITKKTCCSSSSPQNMDEHYRNIHLHLIHQCLPIFLQFHHLQESIWGFP